MTQRQQLTEKTVKNPFIPKWVKETVKVKLFDQNTKKISEIEVKADLDVDIQRNLLSAVFMIMDNQEIIKDPDHSMKSYPTRSLILYKVDGRVPITQSVPKFLFGIEYYRARRINDDIFDLRQEAFQPVGK
ncbi:hypothetical protein RsoM2USA_137 [Ralstonia phage RsoM2USA]|nr:hypothetical protein RsoM2USA_137 [Ralstonia phage RsoM2USA]